MDEKDGNVAAHDLFEYVPSQMTLAGQHERNTNRRWPNDPRAVGKHAFSRNECHEGDREM